MGTRRQEARPQPAGPFAGRGFAIGSSGRWFIFLLTVRTEDLFTPDLFDFVSPLARRQRFDAAFLDWQASVQSRAARHRPLDQASSQATYHDLWNVFARWCTLGQTPALELDALTVADLERYLLHREEVLLGKAAARKATGADRGLVHAPASRRPRQRIGLTDRYVWRMLHLIDRVMTHHGAVTGAPANRAARELLESRPEWQHANARARDSLPEYLPPAEAAALVNFLCGVRSASGGGLVGGSCWQEARNGAAVALHLGAGVTPAEVRALEVASVVLEGGRQRGLPWKLRVPAVGDARERETPLSVWAGRILAAWLKARAELGAPGSVLFPATRKGKPWSKLGHYTAVLDVLEKSGIGEEWVAGGAFRLRHTFALRQLRRNEPAERVAKWLGVVDPDVMARYRGVVDNFERPA